MHSSSVLVSVVLPSMKPKADFSFNEKDLTISWFSGTGAGGQHRNKHQNSCRITHNPTGITATAQTRSQSSSKQFAIDEIKRKILHTVAKDSSFASQQLIIEQMQAAQKISSRRRTYRFQENMVHDHVSGKSVTTNKFFAGCIDLIW